MSNETPIVEDQEQSLDDFSKGFFNKEEPASPASEEEVEEDSTSEDAPTEEVTEELETEDEDDTLATEDDDEEEEVAEEQPKPKKNRFQERIDELTAKAREAERREQAAMERIAQMEARLNKTDEPKPTDTDKPQNELRLEDGPKGSDKNEDGTDKYPLGEFDPAYIRDMVAHTLKVERQLSEQQAAEEARRREVQQAQQELESSWNSKLETARERYPDFEDRGQQLVDSFSGIDPNYGEYLTTTIMSMDYGTDVLYYLANNPDVAKEIVSSGAQKATIALGRLEAQFSDLDSEPTPPKVKAKISKAPPPPPTNKGSAVAAGSRVRGDEDDLDAVSRALFSG